MTSTDRWADWKPVAPQLAEEQMQRAQALRVAREVVESRSSSGFAASSTDAGTAWLLDVARWIVTGEMPPEVSA